jgi:hypothetical protein
MLGTGLGVWLKRGDKLMQKISITVNPNENTQQTFIDPSLEEIAARLFFCHTLGGRSLRLLIPFRRERSLRVWRIGPFLVFLVHCHELSFTPHEFTINP